MSVASDRFIRVFRRAAGERKALIVYDLTTRQAVGAEFLSELIDGTPASADKFFIDSMWLVYYKGAVDPDADSPAWTEMLSGTVAHSSDGAVFTITDDTDGEHLYYSSPTQATLDSAVGSILEARVRVSAGGTGVNRGAAMSIFDGTRQYTAWLRSDGVNIDGEDNVAINMTRWRRVKLVGRGDGCQLFIDGDIRQTGTYMNPTVKQQFTFGSYVGA